MNSESFSLNLQDLQALIAAKSNCSCHFINPSKTRIILWKEVQEGVVTYHLRIGIQKFISYPLTDKNGEVYWRFKPYESQSESKSDSSLDSITKFNQRQEKVKDYDQSNHGSEQSGATNH